MLDEQGTTLNLSEQLLDGDGWNSAPLGRYGVFDSGVMCWIDVAFDREPEILPALTGRFRECLVRFGEVLADQGITYEDHVDYAGYELSDALEDVNAAPAVVSISAAADLEERQDRALLEWDPEEDILGSTHGFRIDLTRVPGRTVTTSTSLGLIPDDGIEVETAKDPEEWLNAAIELATQHAGLVLRNDGWHRTVSLPDALEGADRTSSSRR